MRAGLRVPRIPKIATKVIAPPLLSQVDEVRQNKQNVPVEEIAMQAASEQAPPRFPVRRPLIL